VKFEVKRGGLKKLGEMLMEVLERGVEERQGLSRMKKKNRSHGQKYVTTAWRVPQRAVVFTMGNPWCALPRCLLKICQPFF